MSSSTLPEKNGGNSPLKWKENPGGNAMEKWRLFKNPKDSTLGLLET